MDCLHSTYNKYLENSRKCVLAIRSCFLRCCVPSIQNKDNEKVPKQGKCLTLLNCFIGDPNIEDKNREFKFNKNVTALNEFLGNKWILIFYSFNFLFYYFLVGFLPIYFRGKNTVLMEAHYSYAAYAFCVFLFEAIITYSIIQKVNFGSGNKILKDFSIANYLIPLVLSQIKKYDFYTDMIFIISNLNQHHEDIAIISGSFLALTTFVNLVLILAVFKSLLNLNFERIIGFFQKKNKIYPNPDPLVMANKLVMQTSNKNINMFCKISALLEFECISNCLDKFSTKNAW